MGLTSKSIPKFIEELVRQRLRNGERRRGVVQLQTRRKHLEVEIGSLLGKPEVDDGFETIAVERCDPVRARCSRENEVVAEG